MRGPSAPTGAHRTTLLRRLPKPIGGVVTTGLVTSPSLTQCSRTWSASSPTLNCAPLSRIAG
jgi:hypothetical protein